MCNIGRYLMLSGSRPGTYPANLQGIWNDKLNPPWDSKYTVNINTEMNYWPVEVLNIAECHEALFKMLEEVIPSGEKVAKVHYNAGGWVLHHNTDLWRGAAPINAIQIMVSGLQAAVGLRIITGNIFFTVVILSFCQILHGRY